ncbi:FecR family protein [Sphingobacterium faecale]|uniref:FecR domain-containing protein n=1 Tax=Sphingobacterium faecale TaxID=2803775 RepID=A0ABS1R021_9SPHI|nr:FecR family protein [Sphingobacterium faecale]MBL1408042.1 FecR domain-containing protein [Sphingobacterium faecale]
MDRFEEYYEIGELCAKYLKAELTDTEEQILMTWVNASDENKLFFDELTNAEQVSRKLQDFGRTDRTKNWEIVQERIAPGTQKPKIDKWKKSYKYAAIILSLLLPLALFTYKYLSQQKAAIEAVDLIPPGQDKATLELSDGRIIDLEGALKDDFDDIDGISLHRDSIGRLVYTLKEGGLSDKKSTKHTFHTIRTPVGANYQLLLTDGTAVWLNAHSTLRFPAQFVGGTRDVELSGEAYFDVASNKEKPFVVKAGDTKVQVLGTEFNIAADADKAKVYTTLLEGSVSVIQGHTKRILVPGQQAVSENGKLLVAQVDTDPIVAWKDGYFIFRKTPIHELMTMISKWYDVEVDYSGDMNGVEFGGKFSKSTSLQELLKSLELTGSVRFTIQGRRVTAMK